MQPTLIDHDAELALIGGALLGTVSPVGPEVFNNRQYRDIWRRIKELELAGEDIDILSVGKYEASFYSSLTAAAAAIPSVLHLNGYSASLADLAGRRSFIRASEIAVKEIHNVKENSLDEVLGRHYSRTSGISHGDLGGARPLDVDRVVDRYLDAVADPQDVWGIRTGYGPIDIELGGLHAGESLILAGMPGSGKSMWTTQLCFQMAGVEFWPLQALSDPTPGAMFQMEMKEPAIIRRAACGVARVSQRKVMTGELDEHERERFMAALETVAKAPVLISDRTDWDTPRLTVEVAGLIRDHGIKWVLVDYASLLKDQAESEIGRERKISQGLADMAKLGVAVIAVEQLNKSKKLYGSIQKAYDADVILMLTGVGGKSTPKDKRRIKVEKAREADRAMQFYMKLVGAQKRFEPWEDAPEVMDADEIPF